MSCASDHYDALLQKFWINDKVVCENNISTIRHETTMSTTITGPSSVAQAIFLYMEFLFLKGIIHGSE